MVSGCMNRVTHLCRTRKEVSRLETIYEDRELLLRPHEREWEEDGGAGFICCLSQWLEEGLMRLFVPPPSPSSSLQECGAACGYWRLV